MFYLKNLIKLAALGLLRQSNEGGATEDNNRDFSRGSPTEFFFIFNKFHHLKQTINILQGVTPRSLFFSLRSLQNQIQFHQLKWATNILQGVPPHSFFFGSGSLQNQSQLLIVLTLIMEWSGRGGKSYVGEPLAKFWLLTSVGETESDYGVIWTGENKLCGVTPCKILVARFSWWNWFNIKKSQWGNPFQNCSCYPHLDCLRRPRAANLIRFV